MKLLTIDRGPHGHVGVLIGSGEVLDLAALALVWPPARMIPCDVLKSAKFQTCIPTTNGRDAAVSRYSRIIPA